MVRFIAPDLHDHAMQVGQAGAHALAAEAAHLEEPRETLETFGWSRQF